MKFHTHLKHFVLKKSSNLEISYPNESWLYVYTNGCRTDGPIPNDYSPPPPMQWIRTRRFCTLRFINSPKSAFNEKVEAIRIAAIPRLWALWKRCNPDSWIYEYPQIIRNPRMPKNDCIWRDTSGFLLIIKYMQMKKPDTMLNHSVSYVTKPNRRCPQFCQHWSTTNSANDISKQDVLRTVQRRIFMYPTLQDNK